MRNPRRRHGFTLIELLVVIAIIALLVSILLPSLSRAKGLARAVVCMTNQRNIGTSVSLYANDSNDVFPFPPYINPSDTSAGHAFPQITILANSEQGRPTSYDTKTFFHCPDLGDSEMGNYGIKIDKIYDGEQYTFLNAMSINENTYRKGTVTISSVAMPSRTVYLFDGRGSFRDKQSEIDEHITFRHNANAHALMMDSHVESRSEVLLEDIVGPWYSQYVAP